MKSPMNMIRKIYPKTKQNNIGAITEQKAEAFLKSEGLKILTQNYSCRFGEIDLIMQENDTIVFIEVRYRQSNRFGGAAASVTAAKQSKIRKTAEHFLVIHNLYDKQPIRFDVFAQSEQQHNWIKGAF